MKTCRLKKPGGGKDIGMRTRSTSRNRPDRVEPAFVGAESRISEPRPTQLPNPPTRRGRHRCLVRSTQNSPTPRNEVAELLADIDGVPVLVRFLVEDGPDSKDADLHSLLSNTLEKMVDRMRGSSPRCDEPSKQPLATVEFISSAEDLARLPVLSNDTVLRVGSLELDLLDRAAKRGDRKIDLRPREFQLLKYMMQRSDKLLTRASLLKDVWHYKFVPETNLVDVHMGRLRRKVDGSNEPPLIRNVRGVGFVLSTTPFSQCSTPRPAEQAATWAVGQFFAAGGKDVAVVIDHTSVS
jgi:DNA-binding winged helix-turn-helix (wHTH) protein